MATIGKVSAVFTASTSGLKAGVQDAIASFKRLGGEGTALQNILARMQGMTGLDAIGPNAERAAAKLDQFRRLSTLAIEALRRGTITQEVFASKMNMIGAAAEKEGSLLSRAASIAQRYQTQEEQNAASIAEVNELHREGVISADLHGRAMRELTGAAAAEKAVQESLSRIMQEGAAVERSVATAEERHAAELARLRGLLAAGAVSEQTFTRAVARADEELRDATKSTDKLGKETTQAAGGVGALAGKLNTLIAINAAQLFGSITSSVSNSVRSLVGMGAAQADVVDRASDLSTRLGMTYGELSGISLAAFQSGVSMDSVAAATTKAEIAFAKAAGGSGVAQQAFERMGLSVEELNGLSPAERFKKIADAISQLPSSAERARAAVSVFGRSGYELLPIFENGAGAIEQATRDAERFGLALTNEQAGSVNAMKDSFDRSGKAIEGVVQQVVAFLAPALEAVSNTFQNLIGGIGGANIGQFIGEGIMAGAEFMASIADSVISGLAGVFEYLSNVGVTWSTVFDIGRRTAEFFSGVGNLLKVGLGAILLGFGSVVEKLATIAQKIGGYLGFDTASLDKFVAGTQAFNESLRGSITEASAAAADNFGKAFGEAGPGVEATKGPVGSVVADAIKAAREAAAAKNEAAKTEVGKKQTVEAAFSGTSSEALKAADSRSREGIAEMFRLMRTGGQDVQAQQLHVLEDIRDAVSEGDDLEAVALAGA